MRSSNQGGKPDASLTGSSRPRRLKRPSILLLATSATCFPWADRADAVARTWNFAGSANWSVAGDWNPVGVPAAGDIVNITDNDAISRTITYDYTGAAVTLGNLTIDNTGSGSSNTLAMTGSGLALTAGLEFVGDLGTGAFTQSVGTNTANGGLSIAPFGGSHGTYNLGGTGTLTIGGSNGEIVGGNGPGTFTQTAGTNNFNSSLELGGNTGISGVYTLQGGTLSSGANGNEFVGFGGNGTFSQTAGANTTGGQLILGDFSGTGSYALGGGTLTVAGAALGGSFASSGGQGNLLVNGTGVLNVTSTAGILVHNTSGTSLSLQGGGTINTPALITSGNPSLFNWTGGTLHFTTDVTFDPAASPNSTSDAFGSALTLKSGQTLSVTGNETIGGTGPFSLTLGNGTTDTASGQLTVAPNGSLTLTGGTSSQNLTNNGSISLAGGSLVAPTALNNANITGYGTISSGNFFNSGGTITQSGGNLTISSSPTNFLTDGVINMAAGYTLQFAGGNTRNDGVIYLNNGTLTSNFQINNFADGLIVGPGTISGAGTFVNGGEILVPDGITNLPSFTNTGVIEMSGGAAILNATITNNSTIEGFGRVNAFVTNNGTIQPTGGTLIIGQLFNPASGLITVVTGTKLLTAPNGLGTNAGIISLAGGTFDNSGQALDNTGQISGYGILNTGQLTNDGAMILTGGSTIVDGPVINSAGQTIVAKNQPVIFTGPVTNNGTIKATNNTVTFAGSYSGNAYISDPATNIFQSNVTITPGGSMTGGTGDQFIMNGGTFNNQGTYTNTGLLQSSDNTTNSGTFVQGGTQTWSLGTTFTNTAGTATFQTDAGSTSAFDLSINVTGGTVAIATPQHLAGLTVSGNGTFDVNNNHVLINYGAGPDPIASIAAMLATGYAGGAWNGAGGIISTAAAANSGSYGLGYADAADLGNPAGLASDTIEIKYTLLGDADLNGIVNGIDFGILAANFNKGVSRWDQGDFNYDGVVNGIDFGELAANFNKGASGASAFADWTALTNFAAANGLLADIPEPATTSIFLLASATVLSRRARRTKK